MSARKQLPNDTPVNQCTHCAQVRVYTVLNLHSCMFLYIPFALLYLLFYDWVCQCLIYVRYVLAFNCIFEFSGRGGGGVENECSLSNQH